MSEVNMWEIENSFFNKGIEVICGVDEAGRGPLAGPVCAAAVILPPDFSHPLLNDSKQMTERQRNILREVIEREALAWAVGVVTAAEIDEINILQATYLAMERALAQLSVKPELALSDGNRAKDFGIPVETVVHGDSLSASIAAASVLAKVTRDDYMLQMGKEYPEYGFEIHKGYGTKAHYAAIEQLGVSPIHRMSFLKKLYGTK